MKSVRVCAECRRECKNEIFSAAQWRKGPGNSRCPSCAAAVAAANGQAPAKAEGSVLEEQKAIPKAVSKHERVESAAQNVLRSFAAGLVPGTLTCHSCRVVLPESKFSRGQLSKEARRRCVGCDFSDGGRVDGGVRFTAAVAATTAIQACARGHLARRRGQRGSPSMVRQEPSGSRQQPSGARKEDRRKQQKGKGQRSKRGESQAKATEAPAEAADAEPSEKELRQSNAIALYDQMALIGIAPPTLAPLRAALPDLTELAFEGDMDQLLAALQTAGISDLKVLQQTAMAIMVLAGVAE